MTELRDLLARALAHPPRCDHAGGDSCDAWHRADAALVAVAKWLRTDETAELVAEATEAHWIESGRTDAMGNNPCKCDLWWDAAGDNHSWDQHLAQVAAEALAAAVTPPSEGTQE